MISYIQAAKTYNAERVAASRGLLQARHVIGVAEKGLSIVGLYGGAVGLYGGPLVGIARVATRLSPLSVIASGASLVLGEIKDRMVKGNVLQLPLVLYDVPSGMVQFYKRILAARFGEGTVDYSGSGDIDLSPPLPANLASYRLLQRALNSTSVTPAPGPVRRRSGRRTPASLTTKAGTSAASHGTSNSGAAAGSALPLIFWDGQKASQAPANSAASDDGGGFPLIIFDSGRALQPPAGASDDGGGFPVTLFDSGKVIHAKASPLASDDGGNSLGTVWKGGQAYDLGPSDDGGGFLRSVWDNGNARFDGGNTPGSPGAVGQLSWGTPMFLFTTPQADAGASDGGGWLRQHRR